MLDDIEKLLNLGVGYAPRLNKIKRNLKNKQPLWPADSLYVKQLSEHYLHSTPSKDTSTKEYTFQTIHNENQSSNTQTKVYDQSTQRKQNQTHEKIIALGTGCALILFFMFVIFPMPQPTPSANGFVTSESSPLGFLFSNMTTNSNTSINGTISISPVSSDQSSFAESGSSKIELSSDTSIQN